MLALEKTWDALKALASGITGFETVEAMPVNRVNDEAFLKVFPDLRVPACLLVYLGGSDEARGAALDTLSRWSAVIVCYDAGGEAWRQAVGLLGEFRRGPNRVLDRQVQVQEAADLTIHASCDISVPFVGPQFGVIEVAFTTREVTER